MASVFKPNENGTGKPKKSAKWRMRFKDEHSIWKDLSSGTTRKLTALTEANRSNSKALKVRTGVCLGVGQESKFIKLLRPLQEHVSDYRMKMEDKIVCRLTHVT